MRPLGAARAVACHFSVLVRGAQLMVAGPPVVLHATMEDVTKEQLGGAARIDRPGTLAQLAEMHALVLARKKEAESRAAMEHAAEVAARQAAAEREAQQREERRRRRLYYGRYPYWGSSACWYGDPAFDPYWRWGSSRCWYPWRGYGRRWW